MLTDNRRMERKASDRDQADERFAALSDRSSSNIGLTLAGILLVIAAMVAVTLVWLGDQAEHDRIMASSTLSAADTANAGKPDMAQMSAANDGKPTNIR